MAGYVPVDDIFCSLAAWHRHPVVLHRESVSVQPQFPRSSRGVRHQCQHCLTRQSARPTACVWRAELVSHHGTWARTPPLRSRSKPPCHALHHPHPPLLLGVATTAIAATGAVATAATALHRPRRLRSRCERAVGDQLDRRGGASVRPRRPPAGVRRCARRAPGRPPPRAAGVPVTRVPRVRRSGPNGGGGRRSGRPRVGGASGGRPSWTATAAVGGPLLFPWHPRQAPAARAPPATVRPWGGGGGGVASSRVWERRPRRCASDRRRLLWWATGAAGRLAPRVRRRRGVPTAGRLRVASLRVWVGGRSRGDTRAWVSLRAAVFATWSRRRLEPLLSQLDSFGGSRGVTRWYVLCSRCLFLRDWLFRWVGSEGGSVARLLSGCLRARSSAVAVPGIGKTRVARFRLLLKV